MRKGMEAAQQQGEQVLQQEGDEDEEEDEDDDDNELLGMHLFDEDAEEDLAALRSVAVRAAATNEAARVALSQIPLHCRSTADARRLYMLSGDTRREVAILPSVLTPRECQHVLDASECAVQKRGGWQTNRHSAHPTTDTPLAELDPDTATLVRQRVDSHILAPTAATRGFRTEQLYCRDLFIVKYEAVEGAQASLGLHTDGSIISFNVLLSAPSEFAGGGTFFKHLGKTIGPPQVDQGGCVVHDGKYPHAGVAITAGRRCVLVGFVETEDSARWLSSSMATSTRANAKDSAVPSDGITTIDSR